MPTKKTNQKIDQWMEQFAKLELFHKKNGHSNVPQKFMKDPALGNWVARQRQLFHKGLLSAERTKSLKKLGFTWNPVKDSGKWEERFNELVAFSKKHGHANVSQTLHKKFYSLSRWLNSQRSSFSKGTLAADKIKKLEKAGVIWNMEDHRFNEKLVELKNYFKKHKHFNVSQQDSRYPGLGMWVALIRSRGTTSDRASKLDALGFNWDWSKEVTRKKK